MSGTAARRRRLALHHEAVWLLGVVGGRFPELRDTAQDSLRRHRSARDRLAASLGAAGVDAPGPQLAYGAPPTTLDEGRARVADVEHRMAAACVAHVGVVPAGVEREEPVAALRRAALAALEWDAAPAPFPGLDD